MTPVGFEPTISVGELPKTYALDHAATGTGFRVCYFEKITYNKICVVQLIGIILLSEFPNRYYKCYS